MVSIISSETRGSGRGAIRAAFTALTALIAYVQYKEFAPDRHRVWVNQSYAPSQFPPQYRPAAEAAAAVLSAAAAIERATANLA